VTLVARDAYGNEELGANLNVDFAMVTGSAGVTFDNFNNNGKGT
jgi:hypothetical protein